ncbi:MAG: hypothetical protein EBX06_01040 [Rhodobacteraceae bacterium]|jgi:hypothetical protein|nr:hypothetical protein [Paracoccaceae bacterium]NCW02871.1 hypothetical protein [Paracoccaceae bacterium]NCW59974.1 hypothetical protein [Paracoccaceae bacterium]NCW64359.1 hypothetical protein [Paracoccaceae bacterium]NCX06890.1 hypothetical protein [Paracoccaceae bacterium]
MTQNSKKTKAQLVEELTALGVDSSMSLKKDELVALLDAQSGGGSGEGSGIKPSTPLAGQEDLANRTLDWKYQAPAQDSADAAPSAAPEFVAAPDPEPAAEPAPAPKPEPASAAPSASASQEAGDMSGTTKLLIAVAVIVVLYWIIF